MKIQIIFFYKLFHFFLSPFFFVLVLKVRFVKTPTKGHQVAAVSKTFHLWKYYYRPPWVFLLHLIQVVLIIWSYFSLINPTVTNLYKIRSTFLSIMFPSTDDDIPFSSTEELQAALDHFLDKIEASFKDSFQNFYFSNPKKPVVFHISWLNGSIIEYPSIELTVDIFRHIKYFDCTCSFMLFDEDGKYPGCTEWHLAFTVKVALGSYLFYLEPYLESDECPVYIVSSSERSRSYDPDTTYLKSNHNKYFKDNTIYEGHQKNETINNNTTINLTIKNNIIFSSSNNSAINTSNTNATNNANNVSNQKKNYNNNRNHFKSNKNSRKKNSKNFNKSKPRKKFNYRSLNNSPKHNFLNISSIHSPGILEIEESPFNVPHFNRQKLTFYNNFIKFGFLFLFISLFDTITIWTNLLKTFARHRRLLKTNPMYEDLDPYEQFHSTIGFWTPIFLITEIFILITGIAFLFDSQRFTQYIPTSSTMLYGFSSLLVVSTVTRWLRDYPACYALVYIIRQAFVKLMEIVIGIAPIVMAVVMIMIFLFGFVGQITESMIVLVQTLLSVTFGDMISDYYLTLTDGSLTYNILSFIFCSLSTALAVWLFFTSFTAQMTSIYSEQISYLVESDSSD